MAEGAFGAWAIGRHTSLHRSKTNRQLYSAREKREMPSHVLLYALLQKMLLDFLQGAPTSQGMAV